LSSQKKFKRNLPRDHSFIIEEPNKANEFYRIGNWYLAMLVSDAGMKDCLKANHPSQEKVLLFLQDTREEYLITHDYTQALLQKKVTISN